MVRTNKYGRMCGRGKDNRLEPECWPHVEPGFHFTKDQKFFAIGSCFAQNIAKRLVLDGYNVLGAADLEGDRRNRYTPPAIYQELAWAGRIYQRDGCVGEDDLTPMLMDDGKGQWTDLWSRPEKGPPFDRDQAVASRLALYDHFKGAFESDVVIITLGLIEAWWDEVGRSYVVFDTPYLRLSDRDRFQFERLSFERCRDFVDRTLQLLLNGSRRVLITTSPVFLARTFTGDDVIVANTHSKSVLRAVAGELSEKYENVDYFPSYEIATLTRRPEVWEDDLTHVQPNFIARIMQHVTNAYVPGSVNADARTMMQMANLAEAQQFEEAQRLYDALGVAFWESTDPAVHIAGARLALRKGDRQLALRHALCVDCADDLLYANHPEWMFVVARLLGASPEHRELAAGISGRLLDLGSERPDLFTRLLIDRQRAGDEDGVREVIAMVRKADVNHPVLIHKLAAKMHELGQTQEALEMVDRQLARTPDNGLMLARRARLLLALNRPRDAVEPLSRLSEVEPDNGWAYLTLARSLMKVHRAADALEAVDRLLRVNVDAQALALKARLLTRLGRSQEALVTARDAQAAADGDAAVLSVVQPLLAGASL